MDAKSQVSFGVRKRRRAAKVTIMSPTAAPSSEGNSGPSSTPVSVYGTVNASPAKIANGKMDRPSVHDRLLPKKRVIMTTIRVGISVPVIPCREAAYAVITCRYSSKERPTALSRALSSGLDRPSCTPMRIGVPTAPKVTAVLWIIIPIITAAAAGKPKATIKGAATAAGVPNPAAPSMNEPNSQAMMTTCTRRSSLMPWKLRRIAATPPECSSVLSSRIAPKMISRMSKVMNRPWIVDAAMRCGSTRQMLQARATAATYTSGIAYLAATRNPTSSTPASKIGVTATSA